ncbi:MAG: SpoIIE family protein phosphatase [Thermoanaerobaculia bacterium]
MPARKHRCAAWLLLAVASLPLAAQESRPARIRVSSISDPEGVGLTFAWRFAPGDGAGREAPGFDDSRWTALKPGLAAGEIPQGGWPGTGWFRRHLLVEPALQGKILALRLAAPGTADVYLDGRPVLTVGRGGAPPEIPSGRREACLVTLEGHQHVLAVRYVYPADRAGRTEGIGFLLSLADPSLARATVAERPWMAGIQGAIVAIPLFLAFLHLALFAFDPRARGNLYYALEMATFAVMLLNGFRGSLFSIDTKRDLLERVGPGMPTVAILFGILTYYAFLREPYPRTRRAFVGAGLVLLPLTYLSQAIADHGWEVYFFAVIVELIRLERNRWKVRRPAPRFFIASLSIFSLAIFLQILDNADLIPAVAALRGNYYILGILALAIGVSLSLAHELGLSRLVSAENERKSRELAQARELQLSMLPRALPVVPGLEVAAASHTAAEVGGDYYDTRAGGDGSLLVAFGDATGHGLAAGIVVTAVKALFTSLPVDGALPDLQAVCDRVLRGMRHPGLQMCLALARLSPREVAVASAAMPPILVHRASSDAVEELGAGGLPLGGRIPLRYEERRTDLAPGDTLLFASDGFAELLAPDGREMGYPGVAGAFREAARGSTAREVVERLGDAAATFRGVRPQDDDITFVVVRVTDSDSAPEVTGSGRGRSEGHPA